VLKSTELLLQKQALICFAYLKKNIVEVDVLQCSFQQFVLTEVGLLNSFHSHFHLRVSSLFPSIALASCCESCSVPALGTSEDRHIAAPLD